MNNKTPEDEFACFYHEMKESNQYLKMEDLQDHFTYKIVARNAYVGIWVEKNKAFIISRYKVGEHPYLFEEYHWDVHDEETFPFGTVKPLEIIEKCPFGLKGINEYFSSETSEEEAMILDYLNKLEENNPIIKGYNSCEARRNAAIKFERRLSGDHYSDEDLFNFIKDDHPNNKPIAIKLLKKRGYSSKDISIQFQHLTNVST